MAKLTDKMVEGQPDLLADLDAETLATDDLLTEEMLVNMGPQHPSTHGVLRILLRTDGEVVREATPHIGYLHRCAEKIGENVAPFQFIPTTDRLDYLAAMNNNQTFSVAVEQLVGIEVPERAVTIRILMAELNRIASHLVSLGAYGLDMGAFTPFLYAFRERERIMDLFEAACGARLTYSYITIGGVTMDLPDGFTDACREFLEYLEPKIHEYNQLLSYNQIFIKRAGGVGVISAADAIAWGLTGPCLRASGVRWDLRRCMPYEGYEQYDFEVPIGLPQGGEPPVPPGVPQPRVPRGVVVGDCWSRYFVRVIEMYWSVHLVRQALDRLRPGEHKAKLPRSLKLPVGEIYFEGENPRGQLGFLVIGDGSPVPSRVKVRGPSFNNLSITSHVCRDCLLADVPAIVGSIDIVMGEVDR